MFKPKELFDLSKMKHSDIFNDLEYAWDVLPKIHDYILKNIKEGNKGKIIGHGYIHGQVEIGEGTVIEPNTYIHGPVIIGKNCIIRQGAYIRENAIIGDNVNVGNSTEIKNAVLFNNSIVPHFNYIGDSVIGYKTHLGAGVILSNTKIPQSKIKVKTLEKNYETGLLKFGALIGDNVEIGCNAVMNPGTVIGRHALVYPGTVFNGVAPRDTIVKMRQEQEIIIKLKR